MNDAVLIGRPRYEMTEYDVERAMECARRMISYNERRGWRDRAYKAAGQSRLANFALGNYGEMAVCKWAGVPFVCRVGAYAKRDVVAGNLLLNVRTTRYFRDPLLSLYAAQTDPDDDVFVLAVLETPYVELAGWTTGKQGRLVGDWRDFGSGVPACYVPARLLWPMGALHL